MSDEQQRRLERLLEEITPEAPDLLRLCQAVEVLEHIDMADSRLMPEVKASLEGLARWSGAVP